MILHIDTSTSAVKTHLANIAISWNSKQDRISWLLNRILSDSPINSWDVMIWTTWSDWRYENKPFQWVDSNLELVFMWNKSSSRRLGTIVKEVKDAITCTIDAVETKNLETDSMILFNEDTNLVFPTRIWDTILFYWKSDLLNTAKQRLSSEIIKNWSGLCGKFSERLRVHKQTLATGMWRFRWNTYKLFDLDSGMIYYDPLKYIHWVKPGPLRVVQYTLALALMKAIKNSWKHLPFIHELPTNIPQRLDFLFESNLTDYSRGEIDQIKHIYWVFLSIYHELQYRYLTKTETEYQIIDRDTLNDIKQMLDILKKTLNPDKFYI